MCFRPVSYKAMCHLLLKKQRFPTHWKHLGSTLSNLMSCVTLGESLNLSEFRAFILEARKVIPVKLLWGSNAIIDGKVQVLQNVWHSMTTATAIMAGRHRLADGRRKLRAPGGLTNLCSHHLCRLAAPLSSLRGVCVSVVLHTHTHTAPDAVD